MTQEQIFNNIASLLPILREKRATGSAKVTADQMHLLKQTYQAINNNVHMQLSCGSCVRHYLEMLESYHHREYPLFMQAQMNGESEIKKIKDGN